MMAVLMGVVVALIAGPALAQTEWVEYEGNPVLPPAEDGAWDDGGRYVGSVIVVDGTYHLYYAGQAVGTPILESYEIGHATSSDGVVWEIDPANPVLTRGAAGEWDSETVTTPAVIHDASEFRMWYGGGVDGQWRVGYATSADGSTWTKLDGNPIMDVGPEGSFDDLGLWPGTVIFDGALYRMWYTGQRDVGADDYDWRIGFAESEDGLSWSRNPDPVVDPGSGWDGWQVYAPAVYLDGSTYQMWYSAHSGSDVAIGYAVSPDGLQWTRYWGNPMVVGDWPSVVYDEAMDLYSMWYRSGSLATSDCCSFLYGSVIPAAAFAPGANGSFYETDLDLSNADSAAAEYRLWWLPRGQDNSEPLKSETFSLGAGMSVRYANVLAEVFGLEQGALGALAVESSSPHLLAMSRTFTRNAGDSAGTFGQSMPAVGPDEMIHEDERRRILFGTEHADMRTNVGCQSAAGGVAVRMELFDMEGTSLATETLVLRPFGNDQVNRIFEDFAPITGYVEVWTPMSSGAFYCYGSVLDNETNDPTTIAPQ
jgi:predicted GH43/DUF377 family glycosyl hydrolase